MTVLSVPMVPARHKLSRRFSVRGALMPPNARYAKEKCEALFVPWLMCRRRFWDRGRMPRLRLGSWLEAPGTFAPVAGSRVRCNKAESAAERVLVPSLRSFVKRQIYWLTENVGGIVAPDEFLRQPIDG